MTLRLFPYFLARLFTLALGLLGAQALAQGDPPGRVGRLNHTEGTVTFSPAGDNEWVDAELNRPLTRGDRLWTDRGSRAEVQVGSSAVRMDGQTQLEVLALDDQSAQLSVTQGTVYVRVRSLPEGENFEIDTPNLAFRAAYPGDYRVDVDSSRGTTRVTIHSGTGAVYGESGQALPLGGGQQITFRARSLAQVSAQESPPQDNFDRWAAERNRREDQSVSARYMPREVVGYQQLDAHGQWTRDPTHGPVWLPHGTPAKWAPYRHGRWEWIAPWGWTWIDEAPWGFAPSHYGRWALIESRWAWVPGRIALRPVFAPALVAFIGGGSGKAAWSIPLAAGRPGVAWFPLAPGEAWQPGYPASPAYISNVNRNMAPPVGTGSLAHQGRPEALTAISAEDFHRGRPVRGSWLRVAANALTKAQIVPPPPMPESTQVAARERPAPARVAPPAKLDIRQVAIDPAARPPQPATAQHVEQAQTPQPAKLTEVPKAEVPKTQPPKTQPARPAEQARLAQQAELAQHAIPAEQARLAQQVRAAERARIAQQARAAQRLAQQNRLAEQARLTQQAKAAEQAKRIAQTKADPSLKRESQARRAEPTRREQIAKRAEPSKRQQVQVQVQRTAQQTRREGPAGRDVAARRDLRPDNTHAQRVEQARRAADREAALLREQREQARREGLEREQAQREAWERHQQLLSEQQQREQQAWERQQREQQMRQRPDLRNDPRQPPPDVWQRGIPILNPGRTS